MSIIRHPDLVDRDKIGLLIIDIQDRVNQATFSSERVLANAEKLIEGFKIMDRPIWLTEQYPAGLGPTNAQIRRLLPENVTPQEKSSFSCCGLNSILEPIKHENCSQFVLIGVESHVCVFQSAMDFLANGFQVFLPVDAASSRSELDWQIAMRRAEKAGIITTTTEMILFEMLQAAGTPEFKAISKLVK
jgi:isochorismate hydrolase